MLTIRRVTSHGVTVIPSAEQMVTERNGDGYLWIDLRAPTDEEEEILLLLNVDPMAVEDMRHDRHLPKLDVLGEALSLTVHGLRVRDVATTSDALDTTELDIYVERDLVVTFHEEPMTSVNAVAKQLDRLGGRGLTRPVQLVHLILDTMNDVFVPFLDHLQERIDIVDEDLLTTPTDHTRRDIYRLQRDVISLRRAVVPQAEVIRRLGRGATGIVEPEDQVLFRDVYDHLYRMAQLSDSYRQLLDSALASYRSSQDEELNGMLVVLTLLSAILLPISVIASIWGTNFIELPGSGTSNGFWVMMGSFGVIVIAMLSWFRLRGWIGGSAADEAEARRGALQSVLEVPLLGTVLRIPVAGVAAVRRGTWRSKSDRD